jgi:hypothetical protein
MIYYLAHDHHCYTLNSFLAGWKPEIASRFTVVGYRRFFRRSYLPVGAYIFTDLERLTPHQLEKAARAWQALESSGRKLRLLNHPLKVMRRYELLRTLRAAGINDFDVYRLTERCRPRRFPVFIRGENDHSGPETPLLRNQDELDRAIDGLLKAGKTREERLIIEYRAAPGDDGYFRKYAAFVVLGEILPKHLFFSRNWVGKRAASDVNDSRALEEREYVEKNPHLSQLKKIPLLANIDYGRIDYGLVDGRVQVYEINTNPSIGRLDLNIEPGRVPQKAWFSQKFMDCLLAIDTSAASRRPVRVRFNPHPFYWPYRYLPYQVVSAVTQIRFLRRFQPWLHWCLTLAAKRLMPRSLEDPSPASYMPAESIETPADDTGKTPEARPYERAPAAPPGRDIRGGV